MAKSNYKVATGWNTPLVNMFALDPQPMSMGIQVVQRNYMASGDVIDQGVFVELIWSMLEDEAAYRAVMAQFGFNITNVTYTAYTKVTIYCRDQLYTYKRWNGFATLPLIAQEQTWNFRPMDVRMLIRDMSVAV